MTRARNQQVSLNDTPYYHCISRCVRRAYLCGDDPLTGVNFDHRKVWLVERIKKLASVFSIDICAYAVMSNHYHLVLYVDEKQAKGWTQQEVIERWTGLFSRNALVLETLKLNQSAKAAREHRRKVIDEWRNRLTDISWFMRCLNENIARRANVEDDCTGRFWEGRFKSQALLDEKALVTCMAYVDLNPVRAGISSSPQESDFTSIQERLVVHARRVKNKSRPQKSLLRHYRHYFQNKQELTDGNARLMPMHPGGRSPNGETIPITRQEYFDLLQWSASEITGGRQNVPPQARFASKKILSDLGVVPSGWIKGITEFEKHFYLAAGSPESLQLFQEKRAKSNLVKYTRKWVRGIVPAAQLYGT
ncbi:MAG: transposase [Gammaproteobacteria bacterium]|nr:transposase [Gammaproteobacteria bacterium]